MGRRFCPRCGRWRPIADFGVKRQRDQIVPRSYCGVCQERSNTASKAQRSAEQVERHREYQRIWHEAQRRKAGIAPRAFNYDPSNQRRRRTRVDRVEMITLDPAPLLQALEWYIAGQRGNGHPDFTWADIARIAGIPERRFWGLRHGENIRIDKADTVCVRVLGVPLASVYQ
jgi:hypothetical protein